MGLKLKLFTRLAMLIIIAFTMAMMALAQQDTESLYVQVRDQANECGRGINRSAEAIACQSLCDDPTFNLRVLLGAVPQPIPSEIMDDVAACNAAYAQFKAVAENSETDVSAESPETDPATANEQSDTVSLYPELKIEMSGFLAECEALTRKTRHQVACTKFCALAESDIERLEQGDAELMRQVSGFNGEAKRLPNMNQCRRFYGAATR